MRVLVVRGPTREDTRTRNQFSGKLPSATPANPGYRSDLGQALAGQGRHADAEVLFRETITLDPAVPDYHTHLGQALAGQGRLAEAETAFRESIQLLPSSAPAIFGLGQALAAWACSPRGKRRSGKPSGFGPILTRPRRPRLDPGAPDPAQGSRGGVPASGPG